MEPRDLLPLLSTVIPPGGTVLAPAAPTIAVAWRDHDPSADVRTDPLLTGSTDGGGPAHPVDAVVLLDDELGAAGQRAPAVLDAAVRACRPGGWVAVAVPSAVWTSLTRGPDRETPGDARPPIGGPQADDPHDEDAQVEGLSAGALAHMMTERGLQMRLLSAPGAAARLAGRSWAGTQDLPLDATPGLLDSGPLILAVGRTPRDSAERSTAFFASIARKIVAAAVLCQREDGRLLLVFDTFKGAWTLPGGLVDADESPIDAAVREAWEEGGVPVAPGDLLGVFAHTMPDRVHLVYAARPTADVPAPVPPHDHEIAEVRWVDLDEADALLDAGMRRKVRLCLEEPGGTWQW